MLEIRPFSAAHVPQAAALAAEEYARARRAFPLLPPVDAAGVFCRELSSLCLPLSVAALEEGRLKGFLCCEEPRKAYFGTADGIYSPLWAHGAESPAVWQTLYTAAARLWAENGLSPISSPSTPGTRRCFASFLKTASACACATPCGLSPP